MKTFILFTALAFAAITWISKTKTKSVKETHAYGFPKVFLKYELPDNEFSDGNTNLDTAAFLLDVMCAMPIGWAASFAIKKIGKK